MKKLLTLIFIIFSSIGILFAQNIDQYNLHWNSQSLNSGESMPCGGGDIGLNVWVENDELLFYLSRSGTFDEHNTLLKLGRVRVKLSPNPLEGENFSQELVLKDGNVIIKGNHNNHSVAIKVWVDVFNPIVHVDVNSNKNTKVTATYESWRHEDRPLVRKENNANSWKWAPQGDVKTHKDIINFAQNDVLFYHQNKDVTVFDAVVKQQGLETVKKDLFNPIKNLTFGGILKGSNMIAAGNSEGIYVNTSFKGWQIESKTATKNHQLDIYLHTSQNESIETWKKGLEKLVKDNQNNRKTALQKSQNWWKSYWQRSYIEINDKKENEAWQIGRNYQLFRYMLGSNAYGKYPTKFNGGLFTYDPVFTDSLLKFTPDYRNWGGGTHTAQNQRLVYWPMLRSGDFEMMKPQFDFYTQILRNAEIRTEFYWNHKGASFTEQLENFGLPNPAEYGWKRPTDYDKGMEYNAWLEYQWDNVFEFCMMMMEQERYAGKNISEYIPFIESCLTFFNEHYQYLAKKRGVKTFDSNGHLVLYPGSATETYKMAYNANSTIAALRSVLERLLALPKSYLEDDKRKEWEKMLTSIPTISFREINGKTTIAPAKLWERLNNTETPQLYPVYPWGIYGVGKPGLDTAINTYKFDPDAVKFRSHVGWKQYNIFAARLGLKDEAFELTSAKLRNSGRRFPAFWGPGYDWTPDHNWGGSGMIGLQEMLMQTDDKKILLFPAWPADKDVSFKLHAPYQTIVEVVYQKGKIETLKVSPESRRKDIINLFEN
jgi:hypothetical protein